MNDKEDIQELSTNLTLTEMKSINSLIEVAAQRGIFKPQDFIVFGTIYEKILALFKN